MRRRITRTLLAAAAAGVTAGTLGLTAVGAANAAVSHTASGNIGPTMATTSTAGYATASRAGETMTRYISIFDPSPCRIPRS